MIPFDLPESLAINKARLDHLDSLGLDLNRKSVLEPGAGVGLLTGFWEKRDCRVISLELQPANISENRSRHPWRKSPICRGVEQGFLDLGRFDIVFCYGLLYHVLDPLKCLRDMAEVCGKLLLLETMVYPRDDGQAHLYPQRSGPDQGLAGPAYRPARNWVMKQLSALFPFVYVTKTQPKYGDFKLNWPGPDGDVCRAVFVAARQEQKLPNLLETLPLVQTR